MILLPFANSQYLRVIVMGSVYQAGDTYQRQTSNTNLTLQKRRFLDKRRSFDRRRQLDYLPYFSVILVINSCYFISFLYDKRAHKSGVILLNIFSYPPNVNFQKGIILKDDTKTRNKKRGASTGNGKIKNGNKTQLIPQ